MKAPDRSRLTAALRQHVATIAADLRARIRAPGNPRLAAERLHKDENVTENFEVWTDLLSRRAAVLWVLKSVYIRVLEDRGLLAPGRLLDSEAQMLFERLAPNLGETAFLRWIYKDLASLRGGLPELFSPQPAEIARPADELSRDLIAFWRHRDADTGEVWSFAEERFEGELMGDLYQELDPIVKERFALCQTPDFVRAFILDRTLTPAIETFGADEIRMIDPACGSGHFLIDGLKRLVAATAEKQPDWGREKVVAHALDRVVGVDLNDYACALARARLIMTAADLASVTKLADAARFHPRVYWADGLEQVEREEQRPSLQYTLFDKADEKPRATLTRSDARATLRAVLASKFHAVVANPPYIVEGDDGRRAYHREKVGNQNRYVSAHRQYSLGAPFTERCFQLARKDGFVGIITSNTFMKRESGRPLIERVLATIDLTLIVDTSQTYIPFHGTPTVLLFGRNRRPESDSVRAIMSKRREDGTPADPSRGKVWSSITHAWTDIGFENDYVSVADLPRGALASHPWSLGGGGAAQLKSSLEGSSTKQLRAWISDMGAGVLTRADGIYLSPRGQFASRGLQRSLYVAGEDVRDWSVAPASDALYPYHSPSEPFSDLPIGLLRLLWPYRTLLRGRIAFGKTQTQRGLQWFEFSMLFPARICDPFGLTFANVSTHNHFALQRDAWLNNAHAPVIKLTKAATEEDYLALLGVLNSSTACFWMKQVFHPKTHASQHHHPDPARAVYEFASTGLLAFPVPDLGAYRPRVVELARATDEVARVRSQLLDRSALDNLISLSSDSEGLSARLAAHWREADVLRERMVALQEELDWNIYVAFGLATGESLAEPSRYRELTCPRGGRPFERMKQRASTVRSAGKPLSIEEGEVAPVGPLPAWAEEIWTRREIAIARSGDLQQIETPVFKRAWRDSEHNLAEPEYRRRKDAADLQAWLSGRVEVWAAERKSTFTVAQLVAALQDQPEALIVAEALSGRRDFDLHALVARILASETVAQHPFHVYTEAGLAKRAVWESVWSLQSREDAGEKVECIADPPEYSQGSRGKSTDFVRAEYWRLRGRFDVPKERFIAFTEVPGRSGTDTLHGWAGWAAQQRIKAILAIDEELEDASVPLGDRVGLLDSAWRLLPDVAREDRTAAARLRGELQALLGPEGPSHELLEQWMRRFPPRSAGPTKAKKATPVRDIDNAAEEIEES